MSNLQWYRENSKKLGELNAFLQKRATGQVGQHVIDVVMGYVKELEKRNADLNREIGSYATQIGAMSQTMDMKISELKSLAIKMCMPNDE